MSRINPKEIPDDVPNRKQWIKYQLLIRGYTLADLAREKGVTKQQPVIALAKSYPKWEFIIAQKLGTTPQLLWPERYDEYGIPIRKKPGPKSKPKSKSKSELFNVRLLNNSTGKPSHKVKKMGVIKHG